MYNRGGNTPPRGEKDPLLQWNRRENEEHYSEYTQELKGVTPVLQPPHRSMFSNASMYAMSNNPALINSYSGPSTGRGVKKSYSIHGDGSISYLTPLQAGRHELYEVIPFAAVFGLQKKERNLRTAYASYAADLDIMEAHQIALAVSKKDLTMDEIERRRSVASLVIMDELELDSVLVTTPLIFAVMVAAISQFLVGFNTGVMNAPEPVIFPGHSTLQWSLAVAAFAVGGPFGANIAGSLADTRGRRGALMINMWTFIFGGGLQTLAPNMFIIIVSRFIIGFASGFSSVLVPIYLGELAPPTMRGTLGTLTQFALVSGILVSALLAFPFATESKWRVLISVTPVVAIMQLFCAPWLLESPRWLLNKDASSRKARYIIKKLRGLRHDHEVEIEVDHFTVAMKAQPIDKHSENKGSDIGFLSMMRNKNMRLLVVSCIVLQMSQQLCGINAVFYYSSSIFKGVITNPLVGTTLVSAVNVVATYVALLLMDKFGRRTLLLWSTGGMLFSCVILVLSLLHYFSNMTALIAVNAYVSFFEIGLGPIPWLIVAEMFDAKYVTIAMSASSQLNWACNFIVGILFPYMNAYLGPYTFVPFAAVLLLAFLFTLIWLPETQGTTPEELQAELVAKNSTTIYHNVSITTESFSNPIDLEWRKAIDQVQKDEEEAMRAGTFNYGFEPIAGENYISSSDRSNNTTDWQANIAGPKVMNENQ
mmetsp:Transcript_36542/g.43661  ORF Transcript_36542/g.43661 Transcript_36542/m.43661 type:complete len:707 (+) Transcript_36542:90-2210(+)